MTAVQTGRNRQKLEAFSSEDELQRGIRVKSDLIFRTPKRTNKVLSGACYAAFEVHLGTLLNAQSYIGNSRIISPLSR